MFSKLFSTRSFRSLAFLATLAGGAALSGGSANACGSAQVVYVPARPVCVYPAPVRKVIVVHPAPVYRPRCY